MKDNKGCLVISLDFEMMWGCHDWATNDGYGKTNISHVREVIKKLLDLFEKYNVHATFASVGMLMFENKEDLLKSIPDLQPSYDNLQMSPYKPGFIDNISKYNESLYFASDIIETLKRRKGIEIGTHTFCHYYCWEKGQTLNQFDIDIQKALETAKQKDLKIGSIVFPKNNVSDEYLAIAAKYGIKTYRGNPKHFYDQTIGHIGNIRQRACRLLDIYLPLVKNTYPYSSIPVNGVIMNIPASRFLRPYNHSLRMFEGLKVARIKKEILHAACNNEIYHLWWHPHNFGKDIEKNIEILDNILKSYSDYSKKYGMMSMTMSELADFISKQNNS